MNFKVSSETNSEFAGVIEEYKSRVINNEVIRVTGIYNNLKNFGCLID